MINPASVTAVAGAAFRSGLVKPLYGSYCFSRLPGTIEQLLTGQETSQRLPGDVLPSAANPQVVILLFIDAFGWRFLEQFRPELPVLQELTEGGITSKLTSMFPSTTAVHVTAIHTGLPAGESGVLEWYYYEPKLDEIFNPLLYSLAEERQPGKYLRETIRHPAVGPADLYPQRTIYHALAKAGVKAHVFQSQAYTPSSYSNMVHDGAAVHPFADLESALADAAELALSARQPTYLMLYIDLFDGACHHHGPDSAEAAAAAARVFTALETNLHKQLRGKGREVMLLVTADHGQIEVNAEETFYIDQRLPRFLDLVQTNRRGLLLAPTGAGRAMFLYIRPGRLAEAQALLAEALKEEALVLTGAEAIAAGLFGPSAPSEYVRQKIGDLVILPYDHRTVYWLGDGRYRLVNRADHGGLSRAEMEIPLVAYRY